MSRETKPRREDKKKPHLSFKEKRAKKHEKRQHKEEHRVDMDHVLE